MLLVLLLLISGFLLFAPVQAQEIPPTNTKVAFTGDTGYGGNFVNVLKLIKAQNAAMVIHLGDFDYNYDADGFFNVVDTQLGSTFPYFIASGNHDMSSWPDSCGDSDGCYANFQVDRLKRLNLTSDSFNLNDQMYSLSYKNLKLVFVGQDGATAGNNTYAPYLKSQLENDNHLWKICAWHKNQTEMQVGTKANEMGWNSYETCRDYGAIVATAHEHSYSLTKTLTDFSSKILDSSCDDPSKICLGPGRSFAFVSGLGGNSIRNQDRCLPFAYPYGCNGIWANIYTSDQNAEYGVLFITFHYNGNPNLAKGEFITISGKVVDSFIIENDAIAPSPQQSPTPKPSATPTESQIAGDNDGDADVDLIDHRLIIRAFLTDDCNLNLTGAPGWCNISIFDISRHMQHLF